MTVVSSTSQLPVDRAAGGAGFGQRVAHLPVGVFASVMGVSGLSLAWRRAVPVLHSPAAFGDLLAWMALGTFVVVTAAYLSKLVRHPAAVRAEWRHPVAMAFVPTVSISVLLLATAFVDSAPRLSAPLWWAGAAVQLVLSVDIVRLWITDDRFGAQHVHPGWFIPVVGNLVVPLAGVVHAPVEISWYFFGVGLAFWPVLLAVIVNRLVSGGPLPLPLTPTLAVLIAPPTVAMLSWLRLGGTPTDATSRVLLGVSIFFALVLATQVGRLRRIPFGVPAWALTFPLAALASALLVAAAGPGHPAGYRWLGIAALLVASGVLAGVFVRTLVAVWRAELCRPQ